MVKSFIFKSEKFLPVKVESEDHLEKLMVENADSIFPHAFLFQFKSPAKTRSTGEKTHPDMCLVSHDCSEWWIIEIERVKDHYYATETIQPQIARQADADWSKVANKVITKVIQMGAVESDAKKLKNIEPRLILAYDDHDDLISEIAIDHGFKRIIMKPFLSEMGNYALVPLLQEVNPLPKAANSFTVKLRDTSVSSNEIWIPLPESVRARLGGDCTVQIDSTHHRLPIHPNGMISVPISEDKKSQTNRLVYSTILCRFIIEEEGEHPYLVFREEKRY